MSSSSQPTREAQKNATVFQIWLGTPADGSAVKLFINQNSAQSFQDEDPSNQVIATMGISADDPNHTTLTNVYAIGDSSYPVSGDQVPQSGL